MNTPSNTPINSTISLIFSLYEIYSFNITLLLNGIRWVNGSSFVHNSGCFKMTQLHNGRTDINNSISCWLIKIFQKMDLEDRPFLPYFYNNRNCWFLFRMAAFTIFPYNNSSPNGTKPYSWFREVLNYLSSGFVVGRIEYTDGAIILAMNASIAVCVKIMHNINGMLAV